MADFDSLVRGVSIGLTVAIPVGPMAIMCIRHTLTAGVAAGLFFGAGIAVADTTFAAIAALGIAAVTRLLDDHQAAIRLAGGLAMILLGLTILRSDFVPKVGSTRGSLRLPAPVGFVLAFGLTMANPMTILIFAGLLASYGLSITESGQSTALLLFGVFAGSMGWWMLIVLVSASVRLRTTEHWLRRLNLISGATIVAFGVLAVISAFR